jgi:ParB-like chromosome segregation protein Spo0J
MHLLRLDEIQICTDLQPRVGGIDGPHVRALQESAAIWPPLAVAKRGDSYLLIDGFHRYAAAQNLGLVEVPAEILNLRADADLRAEAFSLNAGHGRPLSLDDRRAEAARLLSQDSQTSNMEASRRVGLSPSTVQSIRERLEHSTAIQPTNERVGGRRRRVSRRASKKAR